MFASLLKTIFKPTSNWFLPTYANTDCWETYEAGNIIGQGAFGVTYDAVDKATGEKVAVKVINKKRLVTAEEIEDVRREVQVMHHLAGHPNVVQVKGVYEDKDHVCIAMELCTGGELFDAIVTRGRYSEKDAAALIRTIVGVVAHCHAMGVIHRDLKPENFLLSSTEPHAQLKAIDFGLSCFFKEGQALDDMVGTYWYVAPEVLDRSYGKAADMWSCGVLLYILLCGYQPFTGTCDAEVADKVRTQNLDFTKEPWPAVSAAAKDCVRRMLARDPRDRATAREILQHEWMREHGCASDAPLQVEVVSRMKQFAAMNRLKKEAMRLIAKSLPLDEIHGLRQMFLELDADRSGTVSLGELRRVLEAKGVAGSELTDELLGHLVKGSDINLDGVVDYEEFLAATLNRTKLQREELLRQAFARFDADGNGEITRQELVAALQAAAGPGRVPPGLDVAEVDAILAAVDTDGSGSIDYGEFCAMMRSER